MTEPGKRRRPGPRRALTEDEILDAALQLLDEGGASKASVRGIAAKVGVAPNAVYTYFPDKGAVIRALVERLFSEVDHGVFADRSQPWRQRVESLAVELRARLAAHPGAVALMIGQPRIGPHALALGERLLELFADAGLTPADAARASHLLFGYVFSSAALDITDLNQPGSPSTAERIAERQRAFATAPADQFPRVVAAAATMASVISDEQYLWGLHRLLDGITSSQASDADPRLQPKIRTTADLELPSLTAWPAWTPFSLFLPPETSHDIFASLRAAVTAITALACAAAVRPPV